MQFECYTHLLDLPLSLGRDDVVSAVLCSLHASTTNAAVVSTTKELQASLVDGTKRQTGGRRVWATQSVPVTIDISFVVRSAFCGADSLLHNYSP